MKIYFLRHGETDGNKKKILQGGIDNPLNDNGKNQAMSARKEIAGIKFDAVYSSPLIRAVETAIIASGLEEVNLIKDDRIREISFGDMEGHVVSKDDENMIKFFLAPEGYIPPRNAESYDSMLARARDFLSEIGEKYKDNSDSNILVVSHGALIHGMLMIIKGLEIKDIWKANVANCAINVVEYKNEKFNIIKESNEADRNYVQQN